MATTMQQVATEARVLLQDVAGVRYSDADLTAYASDCLDVMSDHLPHLFSEMRAHTCAPGARQVFDKNGSKGLIDVVEVSGGGAINSCDRDMLDRFAPKWRVTTKAGPATSYMTYPSDRFIFDLYPPAPVNQVVNVLHITIPPELGIGDALDPRIQPVSHLLVDYVVGMCEAREAEDVGPNREQMFMTAFVTKLKGMA